MRNIIILIIFGLFLTPAILRAQCEYPIDTIDRFDSTRLIVFEPITIGYMVPNQVLEEGVGDAFLIWVVAPVDGRPTLTQGGVFSYYEFTWPLADRLTDEAWQSLQPKPDQPVWTESFVVP